MAAYPDENEEHEPQHDEALEIPVAGLITGPQGTAGLPPASVPAAAGLAAVAIGEEMDAEANDEPEEETEEEANIDYEGLKEFAHTEESEPSEQP